MRLRLRHLKRFGEISIFLSRFSPREWIIGGAVRPVSAGRAVRPLFQTPKQHPDPEHAGAVELLMQSVMQVSTDALPLLEPAFMSDALRDGCGLLFDGLPQGDIPKANGQLQNRSASGCPAMVCADKESHRRMCSQS